MIEHKLKIANLKKAIEEVCRIGRTDNCHIKLIKMENNKTEYYLIRTNLILWQFWYDPKEKSLEMERI